ncbi:MAG: FtsX-like permease family protein [Pseudomonadota bacterium]
MYLADILRSFRRAPGGTLLLLVQVGFTFAVLVNVVALFDSYYRQLNKDSGIRNEAGVLAATVRGYGEGWENAPPGLLHMQHERTKEIIRGVTGVESVSYAHEGVPYQLSMHVQNTDRLTAPGNPLDVVNTRYSAEASTLDLLGLDIVAGRWFYPSDVQWVSSIAHNGGPDIVISQATAQALFGDGDPIGRDIVTGNGRKLNVIGVVRTVAAVNWPPLDEHAYFISGKAQNNTGFLIRLNDAIARQPEHRHAVFVELKSRLEEAYPDKEIVVETIEGLKTTNLGRFFLINAIVGGVSILLVLVTGLGNYGQMSYMVVRRTRQIAIRRALGATRSSIFNYHLLEVMVISLTGIALGSVLMTLINDVIVNAVGYGEMSLDHFVLSAAFLLLVSGVSVVMPVARATRVSPAVAAQLAN